MVNIHLAYTAPINPSSASPVLTHSQCWAGLQRKIRRAYEFVSAITACEVMSENDNEVVREVVFKDSNRKVKEVCRSYEPTRVDFHQPDGSLVTNTISTGPAQDGRDLYMTYTFQWLHPELEEGSEEAEAQRKKYEGLAKMAVEGSIETIRRLVREGEIE